MFGFQNICSTYLYLEEEEKNLQIYHNEKTKLTNVKSYVLPRWKVNLSNITVIGAQSTVVELLRC